MGVPACFQSEHREMATRSIAIKNKKLKSASEIPDNATETPGGTLFGFTPGGSKIVYTRDYLMSLKTSPASMTPPKKMTYIPGVTSPISPLAQENLDKTVNETKAVTEPTEGEPEEELDDMEM